MTKRDFELIAATIKALPFAGLSDQGAAQAREHVAWEFRNVLSGTNARFDSVRFLKACGVQP